MILMHEINLYWFQNREVSNGDDWKFVCSVSYITEHQLDEHLNNEIKRRSDSILTDDPMSTLESIAEAMRFFICVNNTSGKRSVTIHIRITYVWDGDEAESYTSQLVWCIIELVCRRSVYTVQKAKSNF